MIFLLPLCHTDCFNSDASAPHDFHIPEFFFQKLDNRIIFGGRLQKFKQHTVFPVIDHFRLEGLGNLEKLCLFLQTAFFHFDIQDLLHAD